VNKIFNAWAISIGHTRPSFISRYWWFGNKSREIPKHLEGCRVALFTTRKEARDNLKNVRAAYPKARVEKVFVDIFTDRRNQKREAKNVSQTKT